MTRYLPDFAGVFCLTIFICMMATISDGLLGDGDSFWHIKAGLVMLENRELLDTDIFSHTAYGKPWTAHEWLSEVALAGVHNVAGIEGVICLFVLLISMTFFVLYRITESQTNQWVTFFCVSSAAILSATHMAARPHIFTWLFMLVTIAILINYRSKLFLLPFIMILWANIHGGFVIGLVLQIIYIAGACLDSFFVDKRTLMDSIKLQRDPIIIFIMSICAVGINPFGYELLLYPLHVSDGIFSKVIAEWKAPNLQSMWYFRIYLIGLILIITFTSHSITWTERLLLIFLTNAALTHTRHISIMAIALTPTIARLINVKVREYSHLFISNEQKENLVLSKHSGPLITILIAVAIITAATYDRNTVDFLKPKKMMGVEAVHLNKLVEFLNLNSQNMKIFNEYALGGYLIYALTPAQKVFIDGRADMYGEDILADYNKVKLNTSERDDILDKYGIDLIVFENNSNLVKGLRTSTKWKIIYKNDYYSVFSRACA